MIKNICIGIDPNNVLSVMPEDVETLLLPLHIVLAEGCWLLMQTQSFAESWPGSLTRTLTVLSGCQQAAELEQGAGLQEQDQQGGQTELKPGE